LSKRHPLPATAAFSGSYGVSFLNTRGIQNPGCHVKRGLAFCAGLFYSKVTTVKGISENGQQDEPLARIGADGTIRFYLADALGSIIALADENGAVKTRYNYSPFGITEETGEASDNPFKFTGREDDGTGLYYYRARYYSPQMGRFVSEDPIEFGGGINFYVYTRNSPLNWIDPLGLYDDEEVHCALTKQWAQDAGFTEDEAEIIARANQGLDNNWSTSPLNYPEGTNLHFKSQKEAEEAVMCAIEDNSLEEFGGASHMLEDSFSHRNLTPFWHLLLGSGPDKYDSRRARDFLMERKIRHYLNLFNERRNRK